MRIFVAYMFACFSCFFLACSDKGKIRKVIEWSQYDSLAISIDYPILSDYITLKPYLWNGEDFIVGYNHFNQSLDFISLSGKEHLSVELQSEGPDGVLKAIEFCQLNDKVFCRDDSGILVLNKSGKVISRILMADILTPEGKYRIRSKGISFGNFSSINSLETQVFIPLFPLEEAACVKIGKVYDGASHTIYELPMEYPEEIREHIKLLGGLARPQITAYGDLILYNFPISSLVYSYSRKNKTTEIFNMESLSVDNTFEFEKRKDNDLRGLFVNEMITHRFKEVHYCAEANVYFRVHYGAKESMEDKQRSIYLMVCDESSENVREYFLPDSFREQYVVVGNQILFLCKDSNDSILYFAKIDVRNL